jgi:quercetin dioxygenase-like cupin family protein
MARAGDVFDNPVTGERAVVRKGSEDTNDQYLLADLYVRPGGRVVGEHVHSYLTERFQVLRGTVGLRLNGAESRQGPGTEVVIDPGTVHDWWNAGDEEAHVLVEVRPAARFELLIETLWSLARDGKTNGKGVPNLLQLSLIGREFRKEAEFVRPPRPVQRALFGLLAPIARALGYKPIYQSPRNEEGSPDPSAAT